MSISNALGHSPDEISTRQWRNRAVQCDDAENRETRQTSAASTDTICRPHQKLKVSWCFGSMVSIFKGDYSGCSHERRQCG